MKYYTTILLSVVLLASCSKSDTDPTPDPGTDEKKVYEFQATIPSSQTFSSCGYDTLAIASAAVPEDLGIEHEPIAAKLFFNLDGAESKVKSVSEIQLKLTSESQNLYPFGRTNVTLTQVGSQVTVGLSAVSGKGYSTAVLTGSYSAGTYAFVAFPGEYKGVTYEVGYSDGSSERFSYADFSVSCTCGGQTELPDISLGSSPEPEPVEDPSRAVPGWFELPLCVDKNCDGIDDGDPDKYYGFTRRADAASIRNFSACYSKGRIHPLWVAAPMHECYTGSSGRNEAYQPDPLISCTQVGKWTGYTRGHMLGSVDRTVSRPTNRQVFYYSNIGAQIQTGFNTGKGSWNNLENFVNDQWCSDTLYQVIGCIFDSWTDRYGRTVEPATQGDSQIPTAYYKVLLRTKNGNTGKSVVNCSASELKCCAFILAHRSNVGHDPEADDLYTVEDLEKLTGLTFFVNVPNAPKSMATASDWGL